MKILLEISNFTRQFKLLNLTLAELKELDEEIKNMEKYGCGIKLYDIEEEI